jgi:hypothetical protein
MSNGLSENLRFIAPKILTSLTATGWIGKYLSELNTAKGYLVDTVHGQFNKTIVADVTIDPINKFILPHGQTRIRPLAHR